ncbi:MAG TPA: UDP-N-acetylmuramoyl-L-alanine--D-glutamate ligase [Terriglobia bacterium]|nr:UDP-N-acetylmuramoyl-L-alanine--D-glutamate ligase [Terriglobia bacterium]
MEVRGKNVLVVGLGRSGMAAAHWLSEHGAFVTVTDMRSPSVFSKEIPELLRCKIGLELGLHQESTFFRQDLIVISPGVPADLPVLNAARQKGVPVVPEIEVAGWFLKGRLTGITGTNGKTTTTTLLGKILESSGFDTFVGGNIGVPLLSAVDLDPPADMIVAELSSFQLETTASFRPHVAVLLNLSPNHLDRHPSFEAYTAAKARIFYNQTEDDYAILNADDHNVMKLVPSIRSRRVFFSRRKELASGVFVSGDAILYRVHNLEVPLMRTSDVRLLGEFNLENVLAAAAAACVLGADFAAIRRAVREFGGVEHRLEFVREIRGVDFYNDSKATSVDATAKALTAFESGVHLILGGKDKGAPYAPLRALIKDRVREVLVIGAARERILSELSGAAEIVDAGDLETAVRKAAERARPGDVVLLAPACSSFDQFQNFEHRGRVFKELVQRLAEEDAGRVRDSRTYLSQPMGASIARAGDGPSSSDENHGKPKGEELESREADGARESAPVPVQTEPLVLTTPRELEYVYEVSAEEAYTQGAQDPGDESYEFMLGEDDLNRVEEPGDDVFAYEVRNAQAERGSGKGKRGDAFAEVDLTGQRRRREER